ncbi:MAG: FAD-binding oxidoreductase [Thermoplasmata archaeon]|nr:FAD-binding oxidoreductase [Thermoplasmata archaeon]
MSSTQTDVLILGAGIVGCALAHHLHRRGAQRTVVFDPRTPAAGASGRAAGVVTEQLWDRWDVEVTRESHREYAELCRRWDPGAYRQNGFVRFTTNPQAVPVLDEARDRLHSWGVEVEEASPTDLSRWVPSGRFEDVVGALYGRHDACVTPSTVTTIYAESARQAGAIFDFGQPMESLQWSDSRWRLTTATGDVRARSLIVAAGAWSKAILAAIGHPMPLTPYRTQALLLRPSSPSEEPFPTVHDIDVDVYLRPEERGRILGGDGTEKTEADPERFVPGGDPAFVGRMAEAIAHRFPGWAESEVVSSWAGVCTSTLDRHPLVGPVPEAPSLFVATGFNGFGVMRAGGVARRLADVLIDRPAEDESREILGPAWPGRFHGMEPPFLPRPGFTLEGGDSPRF